ncbi:DNA polymerase beta superfamily protein [Nocardia sp. NPDC049526]|uniref:DNA polymerase beta superfamily protein n=1 Tax=Nocardia sp. NPDC049526 TaxID=3364316 RepID=UPI0037AA179A
MVTHPQSSRQYENGWSAWSRPNYSLRPAMALRWLREHPDAAVAPMHLASLLEQCELPGELVSAIAELTELKSRTREMGSGAVPAPIEEFIAAEFDRATDAFPKTRDRDTDRARAVTAGFFRKEVLAAEEGR